ncbi:MAG: ABC-type transport auxiliary lipoprotein family protein [Burkholderiaceae bacterium]|jgi:cholesterol transport system auxiliary component|nr:ABC-type transport auxiliary lipoprotein family protein [Burkholderiaceae bacterium]
MKRQRRFFLASLLTASLLLLAGCSMNSQPPATLYDLGPPESIPADTILPPGTPALAVARVRSPDWLNNTKMYYRLAHINPQQTRFYTLSRWNMPPASLLHDHMKSRIIAAGGEIGGSRAHSDRQLQLVLYLEDFSQFFHDDTHSEGRVVLRVSVLNKDGLLAQKRFSRAIIAATPDAPGGARSLAVATDDLMTEILRWITEITHKSPPG